MMLRSSARFCGGAGFGSVAEVCEPLLGDDAQAAARSTTKAAAANLQIFTGVLLRASETPPEYARCAVSALRVAKTFQPSNVAATRRPRRSDPKASGRASEPESDSGRSHRC